MTSTAVRLSRRGFVQSAVAFGLAGSAASRALAADPVKPGANSALIVIDVQNCFIDGGTLPVKGGAEVVPIINKLAGAFQNIVVTQDWHTPGHASFASTHSARKPFETIGLSYGTQVLWPDHCVQGSDDAALHKDLKLPTAQLIIRKGFNKGVDSYSAFEEADRKTATGLAAYLKARNIDTVFLVGLATDFCVAWIGAGCAQARLHDLRDRGRDARHRPQRLAGRGLEADDRGRREAHPGERHFLAATAASRVRSR